MKNRRLFIIFLFLTLTVLIMSCGKKEEDNAVSAQELTPVTTPTPVPAKAPTPTPTPEPTPTPTPDLHIGETKSLLDGSWIPDEVAANRPFIIMFNNIEDANPQSGTGDAKILYEALTEAGISRLMGVFEGLDENSSCKDRLGSVRSARHYFASIADEYDALFIHYGETTYATKKISKLNLDHLEGTYGEGSIVFYRDKNIKAPHNAFASLEGIYKGIEYKKLRTLHNEDETYKTNHFVFNEEITVPAVPANAGQNDAAGHMIFSDAKYVRLPYSTYMSPYFTYDETTGLYTRYQFHDVHIDYNTGNPLTFTNIIIQIVHEYNKDENGYQDMDIAKDTGVGYYISQGKCVSITWSKKEKSRYMQYFDSEGNVLSINPGRTFISIFPDFRESKLQINAGDTQ